MAQLQITPDQYIPGRWSVQSHSPAALAATCDALAQTIAAPGDALAGWALHPHEQDGLRAGAYVDEIAELGPAAIHEIVQLARPHQQRVVWVDRYHLLTMGAPLAAGSRLLGLYVGTPGELALYLYPPTMAGFIQPTLAGLPNARGSGWDHPDMLAQLRAAIRYDPRSPTTVDVRAPQPMVTSVQGALQQLIHLVAPW